MCRYTMGLRPDSVLLYLYFMSQTEPPNDNSASSGSGGGSGEALPYSSIKLQDLVKLRQAIEKGNLMEITELVESNPCYLIATSGDRPTILQVYLLYY